MDAELFALLGPLVADRAVPLMFPEPTDDGPPQWPAIRWTVIDATPDEDICGDGDEDVDEQRVQLDIVTPYDAGAVVHTALRLQVRAAMATLTVPARLQSWGTEIDWPSRTYRTRMDYSLLPSSN